MRIRIKFTKNDTVKYLGHLDIMRSFQKCFNRAGIKMTYSEGFNPHQKMNFAQPLGVGISSVGEYLDAEIADGQNASFMREKLNSVTGSGFDIISVKMLKEDARKAMAAVKAVSYDIICPYIRDLDVFGYIDRANILIEKTTKTGIYTVDLKDILIGLTKQDDKLHMILDCEKDSLKPELIFRDMMEYFKYNCDRDDMSIVRTEIYADGLVPLIDFQTI